MAEVQFQSTIRLIVERDSRILMLHHREGTPHAGYYDFPTGVLEEGERIAEAGVRIAERALGAQFYVKDTHLVHVMRLKRAQSEQLDFWFETRVWKRHVYLAQHALYDEMIWADIETLPANTLPLVRELVRRYQRGEFFSELFPGDFMYPGEQ